MAVVKQQARPQAEKEQVTDRAKDFWTRYGKAVLIGAGALVLAGGAWLGYKQFIQAPKEKKAAEAIWKTQSYFGQDSAKLTLTGDKVSPGAENVISQYGGTASGNLARYYAGASALQLNDFAKAVNYLKDFETDSKPVQARAYKLLADAYAGTGNKDQAFKNYKNAARHFEEDRANAAEYLFMAAYYADKELNNKAEATELYKELVKDYKNTRWGIEAERYLAQNGVYKAD